MGERPDREDAGAGGSTVSFRMRDLVRSIRITEGPDAAKIKRSTFQGRYRRGDNVFDGGRKIPAKVVKTNPPGESQAHLFIKKFGSNKSYRVAVGRISPQDAPSVISRRKTPETRADLDKDKQDKGDSDK